MKAAVVLAILTALASCSLVQSKEDQCLQSARMEFKDPDSLVAVQNMGQRGPTSSKEEYFFWLRYKAKNSYGGYTSANMACARVNGSWVRSRGVEDEARVAAKSGYLRESLQRLKEHNEGVRDCKTDQCRADRDKEIRRPRIRLP